MAALKTVYDPEIPADIYELGLIYKIDIGDDREVAGRDDADGARVPGGRRNAQVGRGCGEYRTRHFRHESHASPLIRRGIRAVCRMKPGWRSICSEGLSEGCWRKPPSRKGTRSALY